MMYLYANILLLALFAGGAFSLLPVLRKRQTLRDWWQQESFLFGVWQAAPRLKIGHIAFFLGLGCYEYIVAFCYSNAHLTWPVLISVVPDVLYNIIAVCFTVKILLGTKYNGKSLLFAGALYFIARWVFFNGQNIWWIWLCWALLAAKDVDIRQSMKSFLLVGIPCVLTAAALSCAKIIPITFDYSYRGRHPFCYGQHNTFGGILLGLALAWVILHSKHLRRYDALGLGILGTFVLFYVRSRSAGVSLYILTVFVLLSVWLSSRNCLHGSKLFSALAAATLPLTVLISFGLPALYFFRDDPNFPQALLAALYKLNDLFTTRLELSFYAMQTYPVKIAGYLLTGEFPYIDNLYVYLFYSVGPVMFLLVCAIATYALYRYARMGNWAALSCLLVLVAYGFMENQVLHLTSAPADLLLTGIIFALPYSRWNCEPAHSESA